MKEEYFTSLPDMGDGLKEDKIFVVCLGYERNCLINLTQKFLRELKENGALMFDIYKGNKVIDIDMLYKYYVTLLLRTSYYYKENTSHCIIKHDLFLQKKHNSVINEHATTFVLKKKLTNKVLDMDNISYDALLTKEEAIQVLEKIFSLEVLKNIYQVFITEHKEEFLRKLAMIDKWEELNVPYGILQSFMTIEKGTLYFYKRIVTGYICIGNADLKDTEKGFVYYLSCLYKEEKSQRKDKIIGKKYMYI